MISVMPVPLLEARLRGRSPRGHIRYVTFCCSCSWICCCRPLISILRSFCSSVQFLLIMCRRTKNPQRAVPAHGGAVRPDGGTSQETAQRPDSGADRGTPAGAADTAGSGATVWEENSFSLPRLPRLHLPRLSAPAIISLRQSCFCSGGAWAPSGTASACRFCDARALPHRQQGTAKRAK